jgi:beta-lactamase class A
LKRRTFLLATTILPFAAACTPQKPELSNTLSARTQLMQLEHALNGRLGVFALNTADASRLSYRESERFPMCSTFKVLLVSAVLDLSTRTAGLMQQRIRYTQSDLVSYSPITKKNLENGMRVAELCGAALQYSDNTSANLLMRLVGGPSAVTDYARSIGDRDFSLDRWETDLNTSLPGDERDTTTPESMGLSFQRLVLGDTLGADQRIQLRGWLIGNTTGATRIRAAVPGEWQVGDKTGSGSNYGVANDIAVLWPPGREPVVCVVYTTQTAKDAKARSDVIASAARIVVEWVGRK